LIARVTGRAGRRGSISVLPDGRLDTSIRRRRLALPIQSATRSVAPVSPALVTPRIAPAADGGPATTIPLLPGERTPARRLKFAIANGCTVGSLLAGLVAVFLALSGDLVHLRLAAVALLACVVLDGCDGGLARRFNVSSPFGAQLDSLADLSSFGVATGIVTYQWLTHTGAAHFPAAMVCALVAVCAAIRLARFNVSPKSGTHFCGVPTTMAAAVLAMDVLIAPEWVPAWAQIAFVAVYALAMVTAFPYVKLGRILRLPPWVWVVPAIGAMVSLPGTFAAMAGGYLVSGPVLWLLHRRGRNPRPALAS
jgi:CDP-diacylglycerol--serine O-phosphatidyltransferase